MGVLSRIKQMGTSVEKCRDPTMKTARNEEEQRKDIMPNGDRGRIWNVAGVEFWRSSQMQGMSQIERTPVSVATTSSQMDVGATKSEPV